MSITPRTPDRWGPRSEWILPHHLRRQAQRRPDEPYLQFGASEPLTFAEALARSEDTAGRLAALGVSRGDKVLILAHTSPASIFSWFGSSLLGAIDVPLNTAYRHGPLIHALNLTRAKVLVADPEFLSRVAEVEADLEALETVVLTGPVPGDVKLERVTVVEFADVSPATIDAIEPPIYRDISSVVFTSGTTGPAKGVLIPHAQIFVYTQQHVDGMQMSASDVFYCFHPMFHVGGKGALYSSLIVGCKVVLRERFEPTSWIDDIRAYGATLSIAHGPMLEMIFAQPERPDDADNNLRALMSCPFPTAIAERFEKRFGVKGLEVYGATETTTPVWRSLDEPLRLGSCGKPSNEFYEVLIVDPETREEVPLGDPGEIVVRPRLPWIMMQGYLGMPEATVEAWDNYRFNTGDGGRFDEDGYLYFLDRMKDRIRRRAENISSYEVESAAMAHPAVREAAAIGVPSGYQSDDDIKVCVVLEGHLEESDLLEHLASRLPHYMVPRYIEILDALPRTPTNKIRKQVLREQAVSANTWDRHKAGVSLKGLMADIESRRS